MSAKELTLRVLMALRPMLPGLIAVAAVTLLVLPFCWSPAKGVGQ